MQQKELETLLQIKAVEPVGAAYQLTWFGRRLLGERPQNPPMPSHLEPLDQWLARVDRIRGGQ